MDVTQVKTVAVLGAGVMGHGIAEVAALAGYEVRLYDIKDEFVNSGLEKIKWSLSKFAEKKAITPETAAQVMARVKGTTSLETAVGGADVVVEAAPEDLNLKLELFKSVGALSKPGAILASNTSTIPISEIAAALDKPETFLGLHFFNPPPLMPLLEVIRGNKTSDETLAFGVQFGKGLGKDVVLCSKDVPGFIVNRILGPLLNEAALLVGRGESTVEEIDSMVTSKAGLPMGLFELADYSGIDTLYHASKAVQQRDPSNVEVAPLIELKFREGKFGRKTGEGFYKYSGDSWSRPAISKEAGVSVDPLVVFAPGINAASWLVRNGVCSPEDVDKSVKLGLGFPDGILRMADQWGLERTVEVLQGKEKVYGKFYAPDPLLTKLVSEKKTGVKAGEGFFTYGVSGPKFEEIVLQKEPPLAWIVLNRPQRLNAITPKMIEELTSAARDVEGDPSIRVIIIKGKGGRAFSGGADLASFEFSSPIKAYETARRWFEAFSFMERVPKPVIAAITGYAFGGGCELALACDFRLASEDSQIGLTETGLGLLPGAGGTQRLVRLVGLARAKEMIFLAEKLSAQDALTMGLVNRVFKKEEFDEGVKEFAGKLAKQPPLALKFAKYATTLSTQVPTDIGQLFEASALGLLLTTQDASEGVSAFLSKREPEFKGE
jgi:enoyl-CoA hydratase/3-hydroxyacyl-CoA dehydrogenase